MFRGLTVETTLRGKTVAVVFASPFIWKVYEDGLNVTAKFEDPNTIGSKEWSAWIGEIKRGRQTECLNAPQR
jgi:hypothetical protein